MSEPSDSTIPVMFARLEAKLDVAIAQQAAKLDKHAEDIKTIRDKHAEDLKSVREFLAAHELRFRAVETRTVVTPKMLLAVLVGIAGIVAAITPFLDKLYGR